MQENWIKVKVPEGIADADLKRLIGFDIWEPKYEHLLNHGYVGLVDFCGSDQAVVDAARTSYGKGTKIKNTDEGLVRFLLRHDHTSPSEMVDFTFHVKAPIFVFRQWHRHRTASLNEMSARYSVMEDDMYFPDGDDMQAQAKDNKQGRSGILDDNNYNACIAVLESAFDEAYQSYLHLLGENPTAPDKINVRAKFLEEGAMKAVQKMRDSDPNLVMDKETIQAKVDEYFEANELSVVNEEFPGIARELARLVLPVATYSQMYWKINMLNLFRFINLRSDPHAQKEIRVYSDAMLEMIRPIVPWSVRAFEDYMLHAKKVFSHGSGSYPGTVQRNQCCGCLGDYRKSSKQRMLRKRDQRVSRKLYPRR